MKWISWILTTTNFILFYYYYYYYYYYSKKTFYLSHILVIENILFDQLFLPCLKGIFILNVGKCSKLLISIDSFL